MTSTDTFITECVVDHTELVECFELDENLGHTFYQCAGHSGHTYPARWNGETWAPVDQHDYDPA